MQDISIIICTHNRAELLLDILYSFNDQLGVTKDGTEVIVVASACVDNTVASVTSAISKIKPTVRIVDVKEPGLSTARNHGLKSATKSIIAFLDDDIRLRPGWLKGYLDVFRRDSCDVVGGAIHLWCKDVTLPPWLHYYHKRLLGYNVHGDKIKPIDGGNIFGGNFAIRREVYDRIGGFSETFGRRGQDRLAGEEAEYFMRAKAQKFRFMYTPNAAVEHLVDKSRATIEYLTRSALGVGKSRVLLPDRVDKIGMDQLFEKLQLLLEETKKELKAPHDSVDYMFHKTRRFDILGECIGILNCIYTEIDVSKGPQLSLELIGNSIEFLESRKGSGSDGEPSNATTKKHMFTPVPTFGSGLQISVIIPCYNAKDHIVACLKSLVRQTLNQDLFEVIFVDDASTDDSVKIIKSYEGKIENLVVIRNEINKKQGAARNRGISVAKGHYITFLDADDYFTDDALEVMLRNVEGRDLLIAQLVKFEQGTGKKEERSNRKLTASLVESALRGSFGWFPVGLLISREMIKEHKIAFREGMFFEDIEFVIRCAIAAGSILHRVRVIPNIVYRYLQRPGSTVNALDPKKLEDSTEAVLGVFRAITCLDDKMKQAWRQTASKWLLYQLQRIRDQNHDFAERAKLFEIYGIELTAGRFWAHLGHGFEQDFAKHVLSAMIPDADVNKESAIDLERRPVAAGNYLFKYGIYTCSEIYYRAALAKNGSVIDVTFNHKAAKDRISTRLTESARVGRKTSLYLQEIDYLFIPHNHYHGENLCRVASELKSKGLSVRVLKMSPPHPDEGAFIERYAGYYVDLSVVLYKELLPYGIVVMNDWESNVAAKLIDWANTKGIGTYAVVEGVNDYHDVDTGRGSNNLRRPYQRVKNLYLNGDFDRKYFSDPNQRIATVGIDRLDTLAELVRTKGNKITRLRRAVINCNFTYGVLTEYALNWVTEVIDACEISGIDCIVSKHQADKTVLPPAKITARRLYDELLESEIFITRFSGAVFEALIAGCKVIYYNPGIEKIDKFNSPMGAYLYARNKKELLSHLRTIVDGWTPEYENFLRLHTDAGFDRGGKDGTSLAKTAKLLYDDAATNRDRVVGNLAKGMTFFDQQFDNFLAQGWISRFYTM
jgi:glycosyltransferase involved in cell wall biosynthesis